MANLLLEYLAWQVLIWTGLMGWIWFVAKLGERTAQKDQALRKERGY